VYLETETSPLTHTDTRRNVMSKSGYEIRAEILRMAKETVWDNYHQKFNVWENSVKRDSAGVIERPETSPELPRTSEVISEAEKFYTFVNQK
tara:strand:- start:2763 stop:3038 length:276 start_codon:yes stop_codon:yes gene_type:complete